MERQTRTFPIPPEDHAQLTPGERDAAGAAWFEAQERRDGAGMVRATRLGGQDRERLQRGEITAAELDEEMDDDLARIGSFDDGEWDALGTPKRRHDALVRSLGFDPGADHQHRG
jgi:hypothetical protein